MPVDKEALRATIREAVGDDDTLYAELEQKLLANEQRAAAFMGGFLRNRDYTQKNQALADERRRAEDEKAIASQQLEQYRQQLEAAEAEKAKVMKDARDHELSASEAWTRLQNIKRTYQLSDDDIPDKTDLKRTIASGQIHDTSRDLDDRFAQFKKEIGAELTSYIQKTITPELGGYVRLEGIFQDVREQHKELTGKPLSRKEHFEILDEAERRYKAGKANPSYEAVWEEKYEVPRLRQEVHDKTLEKQFRSKWEAEEQARRSEEAMQGVRPMPGESMMRTSNVLKHRFQVHEEAPAGAPKVRENSSSAERQMAGGAERATRKFLERRANGVPMGAPDQPKNGGKVA